MFALACDNVLFFKTSPETLHYFTDKETRAYPWSRNTAPANPEWLESEKTELRRVAKEIISMVKPSKSKKSDSKCLSKGHNT